jgi:hypothetical protein
MRNDGDVFQVVIVLYALVMWPVAHVVNKRWLEKQPNKRPYAWGFHQALMNMACLPLALLFLVNWRDNLVYAVLCAVSGVAGIFVWKRQRWACVVVTVLSLSPVNWITNMIYFRNRWQEMRDECQPVESDVMVYAYHEGAQAGPFMLSEVRERWGNAPVHVCRAGDESWTPLAEYKAPAVQPAQAIPGLLLGRLRELWENTTMMERKIYLLSVAAALIAGALLHSAFAERYRYQVIGNGSMLKTDRWTGKAWKLHISDQSWQPVGEPGVTHNGYRYQQTR